MEREILFRGFDNIKNEWVYGDLIHLSNGYAIRKLEDDIMTYTRVDSNSVGQYTTRKDSKGNKMFEGDIIKIKFLNFPDGKVKYEYGVIVYSKDIFIISSKRFDYNLIGIRENETRSVIGNIFENPDLIKE